MSEIPDNLIGLRGKETSGPRWARFRELNNAAALMVGEGRTAEATAKFEEAYRETLVEDVDGAGFDARARALGNLATLAEGRGDTAEALRLTDEALLACDSAEREVGDRHGTVAVRANILIQRAQTLQLLGRLDDALADSRCGTVHRRRQGRGRQRAACWRSSLHNTRSVLLIGLERLEEAETAARHALELAAAFDPRLTGHPYTNLALIAQATNDHDTAMSYLRLAEQVHTAAGDAVNAALAVANQARGALRRRRRRSRPTAPRRRRGGVPRRRAAAARRRDPLHPRRSRVPGRRRRPRPFPAPAGHRVPAALGTRGDARGSPRPPRRHARGRGRVQGRGGRLSRGPRDSTRPWARGTTSRASTCVAPSP